MSCILNDYKFPADYLKVESERTLREGLGDELYEALDILETLGKLDKINNLDEFNRIYQKPLNCISREGKVGHYDSSLLEKP